MDILDMHTDDGRTKAAEHNHRKKEMVAQGQQLYATIKRSSKYYSQNALAKAEAQRWGGFPFLVLVHPAYGEYCVQGGPGGQYRLSDVNLYIVEDGQTMRIN